MPERSKWTAVAWAAVAAALVFALVRVTGGSDPPPPPVRVDRQATDGGRTGAGAARGGLYVHVAGAVRRPGLYRVPEGSRVAAAVETAGGPSRRAEVAAVNLAAPVEDGQQVIVPRRGAAGPAGPATAGGDTPEAPLSLATATVDQLDELDGIGPTLAERILAFRDRKGGFRSLEQLREVEGIGEKRFEALKESLRP